MTITFFLIGFIGGIVLGVCATASYFLLRNIDSENLSVPGGWRGLAKRSVQTPRPDTRFEPLDHRPRSDPQGRS